MHNPYRSLWALKPSLHPIDGPGLGFPFCFITGGGKIFQSNANNLRLVNGLGIFLPFMAFKITSTYQPTGDQPEAIRQLVRGINQNEHSQVLLGVTGSGKTFTIANVIQEVQKPTLVLTHNKTLTAQLYGEFKEFFPDNAVEYFVSYYDYYQPEAYLSVSDTYIE